LIVWLDGDPEQGPLHTDFNLSSSENRVWLNVLDQGEPRSVDYFVYPSSPNGEISWERITDGSEIINFTNIPTPGATNFITIFIEENQDSAIVYPNPANNRIYFGRGVNSLKVYDLTGRIIASESRVFDLNVSSWSQGLYTFQMDGYFCRIIIQH